MTSPRLGLPITLAAAALALGASSAAAVEPFHALMDPNFLCVPLGSTITVAFAVDSTAQQFNGYEVTIKHDPGILTYLGLQEGSLMTSACPNRFHIESTTDSTVTYAHVVLCNGVSLNGPGELSLYTFSCDQVGTTHLEIVSNPDRTFYDAGLYIWPLHPTRPRQVSFSNAEIVVFDATSVGDMPAGLRTDLTLRLEVTPNPNRGTGALSFRTEAPGPAAFSLFDAGGRLVGQRVLDQVPAGPQRIVWETQDLAPGRLSAGTYFARVLTREGSGVTRFVVVR